MTSEPHDLDDVELRDRAVSAARGDEPFDILIQGADVIDVITGRLRKADVGLTGPLIASVHPPSTRQRVGRIISADGLVLAPGLIDSHAHVESSLVSPSVYAGAVVPRGTTTSVWDPHDLCNVAGLEGMDHALGSSAGNPLRFIVQVPSCVPSAPGYESTGARFTVNEIATLLGRPDTGGLAEVMNMQAVVERQHDMRAIIQAGLQSGKTVSGHARGLTGKKLQAFICAGISSDHELTSATDLQEKLEAGLTIELRGSHPYLLPEFAELLQALPDFPSTVTLCTDDVFPDDLLTGGGLDNVLRLLVRHGLDPIRAIRAATLNAAIRLGRSDLGIVAPGRRADLVLFRDLRAFQAEAVFCNGSLPEFNIRADHGPSLLHPSSRFLPEEFEISADGPFARLATICKPRFTCWGECTLPVIDGHVATPENLTRMCVYNRHRKDGCEPRMALLDDWGSWRGAFATTFSHDSHNLTVFGGNSTDMAIAANAAMHSGGGMAVASGGMLRTAMSLPAFGLMSCKGLSEAAAEFRSIKSAMDTIVDWQPPYLVFKALVGASLACNEGPHLTDLGIADSHDGKLMKSPVIEDGLVN